MNMQWYFDLLEAVNDMPEEQQAKEQAIHNMCPWCRLGLEHTREEHYSVNPQGKENVTIH